MAIMITAFSKLMSSTFKGMRTVTQGTELTTEAQLATPIIIERVQKASCFFAPGTTTTFGNWYIHKNSTVAGSATPYWEVGADPVLAMFMPGSDKGNGFYDFYAYYAMRRNYYMASDQIGPKPDTQNDQSVWMLMEYKHEVPLASSPKCDGLEDVTGGPRPRYVADYIAPSNDPDNNPYEMFEYGIPEATDTDQRYSVTINLRFIRNNGNRVEQLPTDGGVIPTKIFPRNISYW